MKLTATQIESLYAFTRSKYVKWYDLQTELVDHIAEQIKEEWGKNPKLSFEDTLEKVYKRFGIFGFAQIVKERTISLQKKKRKLMLKGVLQEFSWPMILRTICIFALAYFILSMADFTMVAILSFIGFLVAIIWQIKIEKRQRKQHKKLLLTLETHFTTSVLLIIQYQFIVLFNLSPEAEVAQGSWLMYAFAGWYTLVTLMIIVSTALDKKMVTEAKNSYPEAFEIAS